MSAMNAGEGSQKPGAIVMNDNESLLLMYGWIALAVMNLVLIAVAFIQYAD